MDTKAYLMGLFDGEGCVTTGQHKRADGSLYWHLSVAVCMASEDAVRLFIETWGGNYHRRTRLTAGGLTMHHWYLNASKAVPFLEYAAEHSIVKREQCQIALGIARNMEKYSWPGYRKGVALSKGGRRISEEDQAERTVLITRLRSLQGARNRFAPAAV